MLIKGSDDCISGGQSITPDYVILLQVIPVALTIEPTFITFLHEHYEIM